MLRALAAIVCLLSPDPFADFQKAREVASSGDLAGAVALFQRSLQVAPTWGLAWIELADVELRMGGDPQSIERSLSAARTLEPANPRTWLLTGRMEESRGSVDLAIEAYQRAAELRPDLIDARERLGLLLTQSSRHAEAIAHLAVVVSARPEDRAVRANLAEAYEKTGDLRSAEDELRVLANSSSSSLYRTQLARFYERTGQPKKAKSELERAGAPRPRRLRPLPASSR